MSKLKQFQADYNLDQTIEKNCSSRANSSNTSIVSNSTTAKTNNGEATLNVTVSMNTTTSENLTALRTCAFNKSETDVDMNQINAYVAILRISQLKKEDEQYVHRLTITNEQGATSYEYTVDIEGKF